MKLFVLGGSGGVGRHVIASARAAGHAVTALVRPSSRAAIGLTAGVHVVEGDVLDDAPPEASPLRAMAGHDIVVCSLGIRRRHPANPWSRLASPPDFSSRSAARIVAAMRHHGVRRVLAVSAAGVADSAPRMNLVMQFLVASSKIGVAYRDLALMEQIYREGGTAHGIDWLCPRPTRLTDGPLTGSARVVEEFGMNAAISRADVAAWMVAQLTVSDWSSIDPTRTPQISVS